MQADQNDNQYPGDGWIGDNDGGWDPDNDDLSLVYWHQDGDPYRYGWWGWSNVYGGQCACFGYHSEPISWSDCILYHSYAEQIPDTDNCDMKRMMNMTTDHFQSWIIDPLGLESNIIETKHTWSWPKLCLCNIIMMYHRTWSDFVKHLSYKIIEIRRHLLACRFGLWIDIDGDIICIYSECSRVNHIGKKNIVWPCIWWICGRVIK